MDWLRTHRWQLPFRGSDQTQTQVIGALVMFFYSFQNR